VALLAMGLEILKKTLGNSSLSTVNLRFFSKSGGFVFLLTNETKLVALSGGSPSPVLEMMNTTISNDGMLF
jgi:hypothetical protein